LLKGFGKEKVAFTTLSLVNCTALKQKYLEGFLKNSPNLRELTLDNCTGIPKNILGLLSRYCPNIQIVRLSNLNVSQLESARLSYLCELTLENMAEVRVAQLEMPSLECLRFIECSTLNSIEFKNDPSKLRELTITESNELNDLVIYEIVKKAFDLEQLNLDDNIFAFEARRLFILRVLNFNRLTPSTFKSMVQSKTLTFYGLNIQPGVFDQICAWLRRPDRFGLNDIEITAIDFSGCFSLTNYQITQLIALLPRVNKVILSSQLEPDKVLFNPKNTGNSPVTHTAQLSDGRIFVLHQDGAYGVYLTDSLQHKLKGKLKVKEVHDIDVTVNDEVYLLTKEGLHVLNLTTARSELIKFPKLENCTTLCVRSINANWFVVLSDRLYFIHETSNELTKKHRFDATDIVKIIKGPNNQLITIKVHEASQRTTLNIYDVESGRIMLQKAFERPISAAAYIDSNNVLISAGTKVYLLNINNKTLLTVDDRESLTAGYTQFVLTARNKIIAIAENGICVIYDRSTISEIALNQQLEERKTKIPPNKVLVTCHGSLFTYQTNVLQLYPCHNNTFDISFREKCPLAFSFEKHSDNIETQLIIITFDQSQKDRKPWENFTQFIKCVLHNHQLEISQNEITIRRLPPYQCNILLRMLKSLISPETLSPRLIFFAQPISPSPTLLSPVIPDF